jgi:hypothetical protein
MEIRIPSDPIILSIILGSIAFVVSMIVFVFAKPRMVTKINDDKKKTIDWFRLIIASIMIDIGISICVFLVLTKDRKVEYHREKMGFHRSY